MSKNYNTDNTVSIESSIDNLKNQALNEANINIHIRPLFTKALQNNSTIYLANHSLGRMLDLTESDVIEALQYWTFGREEAWNYWLIEIETFRQQTAELIGAISSDSIIPKSSAGQALRAVLNCYQKPINVIYSADEFNSIDFILKAYAQKKCIHLKVIQPAQSYKYQLNDFINYFNQKPELLIVSLVFFTSGQWLPDLKPIIDIAHQQGTKIMLDLYHAAGVVPVNVTELDVDFAIGGSYKYLRGGPGASWLYINPRHLNGSMQTLDTGWFAQDLAFSFERPQINQYAKGGNAFLESTPAILPFYQARSGLKFTLAIGVSRLRAYSLLQQQYIEGLLKENNIPFLGHLNERGAFIAIPHKKANLITTRLKQARIICDCRENLLRLCPDILNTKAELATAIEKLAKIWHNL